MEFKMRNLFLILAFISVVACESKDDEAVPKLDLSISKDIHFTQYALDNEKVTVGVETNQAMWSVSSNQNWCRIERQNTDFIVSAIPNNGTVAPPKATITVKAGKILTKTLYVSQDAAKEYISIMPQSQIISAAGGKIGVSVKSNVAWQVSSNQNWVSINKDSGRGDDSISLTVTGNSTAIQDYATVTFKAGAQYATLAITRQAAMATISVSPQIQTVPAKGGVIEVVVTSNANWQVSSNQNWVSINKDSGRGDDSISLTVTGNSTAIQDYATVTFKAGAQYATLAITRQAAIATISVSPQIQTVPAKGGMVNVSVTSNANWQVSSDKSWVTINKPSSSGNANVSLVVAENMTAIQDYATVIFRAGTQSAVLTITRQAFEPTISISPQTQSVSATGGNFSLLIFSNTSWQISSNQSWATVNSRSGLNNADVTISIVPNKSSYQDYATITVFSGTRSTALTIIRQAGPVYSIGDYYPDPNSASNALGIVFAIDNLENGAGYHGKILSANAVKGQFWYDKIYGFSWVLVGATSRTNGKFNVEAVKKSNSGNTTGYAAFAYCKRKTDGGLEWYLPAIDELRTAYALRHIITPKIASLGGVDIREDHISSTEETASSMYYMRRRGDVWTGSKTETSFYTRPIATF